MMEPELIVGNQVRRNHLDGAPLGPLEEKKLSRSHAESLTDLFGQSCSSFLIEGYEGGAFAHFDPPKWDCTTFPLNTDPG